MHYTNSLKRHLYIVHEVLGCEDVIKAVDWCR